MATERLVILAGAVALREFTTPELAAHVGASPGTVRQVLAREQKLHSLFERSRPTNAILWRLKDPSPVLDEIAREESQAAGLRSVTGARNEQNSPLGDLRRMALLLTSAEDATAQSYEVEGVAEQKALAQIAINLLDAADPTPVDQRAMNNVSVISQHWWERSPKSNQFERDEILPYDDPEIEEVDALNLGVWLFDADLKAIYQQARRIAAFAYLAERHSEGLPVGAKHLMPVSEAIASGSATLPPHVTESWLRRIIGLTTASSENPPPVAVLTQPGRLPDELFPVERGTWRQVRMPAAIGPTRYALWVEDWAEPLFAARLIPGVVISHEDTPEADDVLTRALSQRESILSVQAKIVVSTADNLDGVARKVSIEGGTLYPIRETRETREGLLKAVSRAVTQAVRITYGPGSDSLPEHINETYAGLHLARPSSDPDSRGYRPFPNAGFLSLLANLASIYWPEAAESAAQRCAEVYWNLLESENQKFSPGVGSTEHAAVTAAPGNSTIMPPGGDPTGLDRGHALTQRQLQILQLISQFVKDHAYSSSIGENAQEVNPSGKSKSSVLHQLTDDLDGSEAKETVRFGFDGREYEIDLNAVHAGELRRALKAYTSAGRRISGNVRRSGRAGARERKGGPRPSEVREWAKSQGIVVRDRGRVSEELVGKFKAATEA